MIAFVTSSRRTCATLGRLVLVGAALAALPACASQRDRLSDVGKPPVMAPIEDPSVIYGRQPVMMPMPAAQARAASGNSLWQAGARSFFDDPRATEIGDILTVLIDIEDTASVTNTSNRSRTSSEEAGVDAFLGLESGLGQFLPGGFNPSTALDFDSSSSSNGSGTIDRSEQVSLTVAALVTQVLPNGNLVIAGRQEVRINHEVRELTVTGVVRPEDVTADNAVRHTQIAEARISYGGRGVISDVQAPRYGQEAVEILYPF